MLELVNIRKDYGEGDNIVHALKGASITFRKSEFVAILGPSGCGKTTLLNIIGGLDKYTSGDLIINGRSTKQFRAYDWDAYRNNYIGFVFQSYNLIPHQSVLGNVELALTLSGMSKSEQKERAVKALEMVGLKDQLNKKPNQMSGGQMQRVAIARSLVNDPAIILADEPTGALDSVTSVQVMDILREISSERLIIMVTHNDEIANKYANRIIRLHDGEVISDTNPFNPTEEEKNAVLESMGIDIAAMNEANELAREKELIRARREERKAAASASSAQNSTQTALSPEGTGDNAPKKGEAMTAEQLSEIKAKAKEDKARLKSLEKLEKKRRKQRKGDLNKTSMKFRTALGLSGKNLLSKKGRTIMTSFAGSIGIIGIALVLSISNGFSLYINKLQAETLSSVPISITPISYDFSTMGNSPFPTGPDATPFPDGDKGEIYEPEPIQFFHYNRITREYVDHLAKLPASEYIDIMYNYGIDQNLVTFSGSGSITAINNQSGAPFQQMINNPSFMETQYDVLAGSRPAGKNANGVYEVGLIIDKYNRVSADLLRSLGYSAREGEVDLDSFLGKQYKILHNDNYYEPLGADEFKLSPKDGAGLAAAYNANDPKDITIEVVGVMRVNKSAPINLYSNGLVYTKELTDAILVQNTGIDSNAAQVTGQTKSAIVARQEQENNVAKEYQAEGNKLGIQRALEAIVAARLDNSLGKVVGYNLTTGMNYAESVSRLASRSAFEFPPLEVPHNNDTITLTPVEAIAFMKLISLDEIKIFIDWLPEGSGAGIFEYLPVLKSAVDGFFYQEQLNALNALGGTYVPASISIYPLDFESKARVLKHLDAYNTSDAVLSDETKKITYMDTLSILGDTMGTLVNIISYVLIAFAAISLVVSSIMIGIITYVSVIERTKEIGVLRSLGARKKDITTVFNAETIIIGLIAGLIGVALSALLTIPINWIISLVIAANGGADLNIGNLAVLNPLHGLALVGISIVLTLVSGLIPAFGAAKKDPVVALRSE